MFSSLLVYFSDKLFPFPGIPGSLVLLSWLVEVEAPSLPWAKTDWGLLFVVALFE